MGTDYKCYKCQKVGNYEGESKLYFTCPECLYKIRLDRAVAYFQGKEWQKPKRKDSQKSDTPQLPEAEEQRTPPVPMEETKSKMQPSQESERKPKSPEIKKFSNLADFNMEVLKNKSKKPIMQPQSEGLTPEELFPATGSKICKKHNLPAAYDEGKRKWMCQGCYSDSIKQSESYKKSEKEKKVVPNNQEDENVVVIEEIKDETEVQVVNFGGK